MSDPHPATPLRSHGVDALRGAALLWMAAFHFCFDLAQFGHLNADFLRDPLWTWQRVAIVSLFLFCVGQGIALAQHNGQSAARFWRRWSQIAAGAALVTLGSWWMFPASFIYFGILHGVAAMLPLARLAAQRLAPWQIAAAAVLLLLAPHAAAVAHRLFPIGFLNSPAWNWLGLISVKPRTEDYAPIAPWLGVVLLGLLSARWLLEHRPGILAVRLPLLQPLAWLGRRSLAFYLLHQPLLIGLLQLQRWLG